MQRVQEVPSQMRPGDVRIRCFPEPAPPNLACLCEEVLCLSHRMRRSRAWEQDPETSGVHRRGRRLERCLWSWSCGQLCCSVRYESRLPCALTGTGAESSSRKRVREDGLVDNILWRGRCEVVDVRLDPTVRLGVERAVEDCSPLIWTSHARTAERTPAIEAALPRLAPTCAGTLAALRLNEVAPDSRPSQSGLCAQSGPWRW